MHNRNRMNLMWSGIKNSALNILFYKILDKLSAIHSYTYVYMLYALIKELR